MSRCPAAEPGWGGGGRAAGRPCFPGTDGRPVPGDPPHLCPSFLSFAQTPLRGRGGRKGCARAAAGVLYKGRSVADVHQGKGGEMDARDCFFPLGLTVSPSSPSLHCVGQRAPESQQQLLVTVVCQRHCHPHVVELQRGGQPFPPCPHFREGCHRGWPGLPWQ